jgi:hypothetical protein
MGHTPSYSAVRYRFREQLAVKLLIRFLQERNWVPVALQKQQLDYYMKSTRLPSLQITTAFGCLIETVKRGRL